MNFRFSLLVFVALMGIFNACKKTDEEPLPTVDFVATDDGTGAVQFYTTTTNTTSYFWDFGDGKVDSVSATPLHVYPRNGTFTVTLKVTGPGGSVTLPKSVTVTGVRGKASFFKLTGNRSLEIYLDAASTAAGVLSSNSANATPACGATGTLQLEQLTPGQHRYLAREQQVLVPKTYEGTFTVTGGQCIGVKIL